MRKSGAERRAKRVERARERALRLRWTRLYCRVYGAPSPTVALTWRNVVRTLAARGLEPRGV